MADDRRPGRGRRGPSDDLFPPAYVDPARQDPPAGRPGADRAGPARSTGGPGVDAGGYDHEGFDRAGLDREGYDRYGYDLRGYDRDGYDQYGYDAHGFDRHGYDRAGYDPEGYDREGDRVGKSVPAPGDAGPGYVAADVGAGYVAAGVGAGGHGEAGGGAEGEGHYDDDGYDDDDHAGYDDDGYDDDGHDGYDDDGYDRAGYDHDGYDHDGYDHDGYDRAGYVDGYGPTARRGRGRRRHPILAGFLIILVVVVVVAGGGLLWAVHQINPGGKPGAKVEVTIPAGSSTAQIGSALAAAGVIHGGSLFRYYVRIEGDGPLLPGRYLLAKNEPYDKVISVLQTGPAVVVDKLVIPEGFTLRQIANRVARLKGLNLSASRFLAASADGSVRSEYEPKGVNDLEGLVFPATYTIDVGSASSPAPTEAGILQLLVQTFDQRMTTLGLAAGAARLHMTPYDVIKVASIIEGEAKINSQRADVASVIYNRLAQGIALGTDSTLVYALRLKNPNIKISSIDYNQPNPYSTRLHKGLPPTPIDNPSIPSLEAAISPAHTNLLYFVEINPNGTLGFASDSAGFATLQQQCAAAHLC